MDKQSIVGSLQSIRIRIHGSWYLIIILIAVILVTQYPAIYPYPERVLLGLLGGLLFLASLAVVQFLTNLITILARIPEKNCTLFAFGIVAPVPEDGLSPGREAIAGVATFLLNLIMAVVFNWLFLSQSSTNDSLIILILQWLAFSWYFMAVLQVLPGLPLAGGRILAAIDWKASHNYLRSMRRAALFGRIIGIGLGLVGIVLLFRAGQPANGLALIFFGWALQAGATFNGERVTLLSTLQNTTADKIMTKEFPSIGSSLNLKDLIRDHVMATGQDFFAVTDQGKLLGIVTTQNIKRVPRNRWDSTTAGIIMTPAKMVKTVPGHEPAVHVLEEMDQLKVDHIPISQNGEIIGIAVRDNLYRLARIRGQLKI